MPGSKSPSRRPAKAETIQVVVTADLLDLAAPVDAIRARNQGEAKRVAIKAYPFVCCVVCGLTICLEVAHLDQNAGNNSPNNLARLCPTHHGMFDRGLYPVEAIRLLQAHWQITEGRVDHKARMKDAGAKAATTRKRGAAARKAVATRRAKADANR